MLGMTSENGEHASRSRDAIVMDMKTTPIEWQRTATPRRTRSMQWPHESHETKRHVYKRWTPRRQTHAGGDRRRTRGNPVGERPPAPCAVEHRGRGQRPSGARRGRAPARGYFAGRRKQFALAARSVRHGLSTQGVERAADDPVWRNAILPADRDADRTSRAPCARSARPTAEIPCRSWRRAIASSDRPARSRDLPAASTSRRNCWRSKAYFDKQESLGFRTLNGSVYLPDGAQVIRQVRDAGDNPVQLEVGHLTRRLQGLAPVR